MWKLVTFDELRATHPRLAKCGWGVLDLLAPGATCTWMNPVSQELSGFRVFPQPTFLQNGRASTLQAGLDTCLPSLSSANVGEVLAQAPLALWTETPDDCSSNSRKKEYFSQNCLPANTMAVCGKCGAHQCQRIVQNRQQDSIGNIYSCHVVSTNVQNQAKLQDALYKIIETDMERGYVVGRPDAQLTARNLALAKHTFFRRQHAIVAGIDEADAFDYDETSNEFEAMRFFLNMYNGDWS